MNDFVGYVIFTLAKVLITKINATNLYKINKKINS